MDYFKRESLWEYVQEYTEVVAIKYHNEGNSEQACKYFYLSFEAKMKCSKGGFKMRKLLSIMGMVTVLSFTLGITPQQSNNHQAENIIIQQMADGNHGG